MPSTGSKYRKNYAGKKGTSYHKTANIRPGADSRLKGVFSRIGVPGEKRFKPDPFQIQALSAIKKTDCLVSAPTGSGKTWIAKEAISDIFENNGRSWYASPLKALTNSKYLEFGNQFGKENVGILTGDRVENSNAPIIVGTTEILRNQLYDAMHKGEDLGADLVILDEAHFLGDPERGVVWEEVLIYLPVRIPLLMLSATIRNSRQISEWLQTLRQKECIVIEERGRPVPLYPLFFHPAGRLVPLMSKSGLDKKVIRYLNDPRAPVITKGKKLPPFGEILNVLRRFNLLPAIFFLKSRSDCNEALDLCEKNNTPKTTERAEFIRKVNELLELYPHLERHNQIWHLKNLKVAAHHGGQLPLWKLMIEDLMAQGALEAIFATSTVAAGINVPARSIVLLNSDRFNGTRFAPLTATEFHQMTGRAGRRGMDNIGFAVAIPGTFMDLNLIETLLKSPPEDVKSQIKIDFSMTLNLLLSHSPEKIKEILYRSFANFLNTRAMGGGATAKLRKTGKMLMEFLPESLCGSPEAVLNLTRKRANILNELRELGKEEKKIRSELSKTSNLVPGRLFLDKKSRLYCAIKRQTRKNRPGVLACRVKLKPKRKKPPKLRFFTPEKIFSVLDKVIEDTSYDQNKLLSSVMKVSLDELPPPMENLPLGEEELSRIRPLRDRIIFLEQELDNLICNNCSHFSLCHGKKNKSFRFSLNDYSEVWDTVNAVRESLWSDFLRHINFLKETGYVKDDDTLTDDGRWASKLRIDQPVMVAECLRLGLFPDSDPALLAALMATFVFDKEIDTEFNPSSAPGRLLKAYEKMKKGLIPTVEKKMVYGFPLRPAPLWAASTIYAWARGLEWENVLDIAGMSEGDLSMLVSRTADNLRHISNLTEVYSSVAKTAGQAIGLILKEPVVFY